MQRVPDVLPAVPSAALGDFPSDPRDQPRPVLLHDKPRSALLPSSLGAPSPKGPVGSPVGQRRVGRTCLTGRSNRSPAPTVEGCCKVEGCYVVVRRGGGVPGRGLAGDVRALRRQAGRDLPDLRQSARPLLPPSLHGLASHTMALITSESSSTRSQAPSAAARTPSGTHSRSKPPHEPTTPV